jgi:hypothetical protein
MTWERVLTAGLGIGQAITYWETEPARMIQGALF